MTDEGPSKDMVEEFEGTRVQVFLSNGAAMYGNAHFEGNWVRVKDERRSKSALCNLDHTVSITRND